MGYPYWHNLSSLECYVPTYAPLHLQNGRDRRCTSHVSHSSKLSVGDWAFGPLEILSETPFCVVSCVFAWQILLNLPHLVWLSTVYSKVTLLDILSVSGYILFRFMDTISRLCVSLLSWLALSGFLSLCQKETHKHLRTGFDNLVKASRLLGDLSSTNVWTAGDMGFINCSWINKSSTARTVSGILDNCCHSLT